MADLEELRSILRRLRDPERGCPWDREQTFDSIAPYTIEEAYEVDDAIRRGAWGELCDELGDLLLQVVYHAQMADEAGHFQLDDVVAAICDKLVRRHPHVFEGGARPTAGDVARSWEVLKAEERAERAEDPLGHVAMALPALLRAAKLQRRATAHGLGEEPGTGWVGRLDDAFGPLSQQSLGELIAACAREASRRGLDPEALLREENARFEARVRSATGSSSAAPSQRGAPSDSAQE